MAEVPGSQATNGPTAIRVAWGPSGTKRRGVHLRLKHPGSARMLATNVTFNPDCMGRRYTAPAQTVDRARHDAYRAAVLGGEWAPSRPLAGFAAVYLLWPIVPQLFSDPDVGLDLPRLLHGEQEFWFDRPVRFGEVLVPEGVITRAEERRGMVFLELTCHGRDAADAEVAHSRSLFLVRGEP